MQVESAAHKEGLRMMPSDSSYHSQFNINRNLEGLDTLQTGYSYFFFTKPQLNLDQSEDLLRLRNPFFMGYFGSEGKKRSKGDAYAKQFKGGGFIHPLTNLGLNFTTSDRVLDTTGVSETLKGYKRINPLTSIQSRMSGEFTIKYFETSEMYIYTFHKLWMDYMEAVREGYMVPEKDAVLRPNHQGYIDYMNSVFYFLLEPDNKTVKYYCKLTGVFPVNIPYSELGWEIGSTEVVQPTITYSYNFKEEMNPLILKEFNAVQSNLAVNKNRDQLNDMDFANYVEVMDFKGSYKLNFF